MVRKLLVPWALIYHWFWRVVWWFKDGIMRLRNPLPQIGDWVRYHDEGPFLVLDVNRRADEVLIEHGDGPVWADYYHCCEPT